MYIRTASSAVLEEEYLKAALTLTSHGHLVTDDRTGIPTYRSDTPFFIVFGHPIDRGKNADGNPSPRELLSFGRRKVPYQSIWKELLWFLSGSTSLEDLHRVNAHFWDSWEVKPYLDRAGELVEPPKGQLGPIYGKQWRRWGEQYIHQGSPGQEPVDQIAALIEGLKHDPHGRRHEVVGWDPLDFKWHKEGKVEGKLALPPCHGNWMSWTVLDGLLNLAVTCRSTDLALGGVFNLMMYDILLHLVAHNVELGVGSVSFALNRPHVYLDQVEGLERWARLPEPPHRPSLKIQGAVSVALMECISPNGEVVDLAYENVHIWARGEGREGAGSDKDSVPPRRSTVEGWTPLDEEEKANACILFGPLSEAPLIQFPVAV